MGYRVLYSQGHAKIRSCATSNEISPGAGTVDQAASMPQVKVRIADV